MVFPLTDMDIIVKLWYNLQGDQSVLGLYFVDFDLRIPQCCQCSMPILQDLQLPKHNEYSNQSTKCCLSPSGPPCMPAWEILVMEQILTWGSELSYRSSTTFTLELLTICLKMGSSRCQKCFFVQSCAESTKSGLLLATLVCHCNSREIIDSCKNHIHLSYQR